MGAANCHCNSRDDLTNYDDIPEVAAVLSDDDDEDEDSDEAADREEEAAEEGTQEPLARRASARRSKLSLTGRKSMSFAATRISRKSTRKSSLGKASAAAEERVKHFLSQDKLNKLLEASGEDLGRTFSLDTESVLATTKGKVGGFACAVSDPTAEDCPLMFVSQSFEDLTGYTADMVVGRSCRFLQPSSQALNDAINLEERKMMHEFCVSKHQPGLTIVNLLLNERNTGERFWNLLRMQHVMVDGDCYIFAVQTDLNAFMPKLLAKRVANPAKNKIIVNAISSFTEALARIRAELRTMLDTPFMELKGYFTCSMNYLQMLPLISKASPSLQKGIADGQVLKKGVSVQVVQNIKYPSFTLPPKSTGKITAMDSFGNAVVEWQNISIGTKGVLKRDFGSLKVVTEQDMMSMKKVQSAKEVVRSKGSKASLTSTGDSTTAGSSTGDGVRNGSNDGGSEGRGDGHT
jgi:hypothetical protein